MKKTKKHNSLFEKEMGEPSFRKKFEDDYPSFKLELQLLNELEKRGITYLDLARAIGTHKSNISRDLKSGGIQRGTLNRIKKMANALDCLFIPLIIPKEKGDEILSRISKILTHM